MKIIPLTNGYFATVDDEDFEQVNQFKWYCAITGNGSSIYARRSVREKKKIKSVYMHRFIMDCPKGMETDHINRGTLCNCKFNLRNVTKQMNLINRNYERRV